MNDTARTDTPPMRQLKHLLQQLGMTDWWTILSQWLPNFDGWLATMDANEDPDARLDDTPAQEIVDYLQRHSRHVLLDDIRLATEISGLNFMWRRARLTKSGKRWSSFEESYREFASTEPDEIPHVFEHEPNSVAVTKYWLLGKLYELQSERLRSNPPTANGIHASSHY